MTRTVALTWGSESIRMLRKDEIFMHPTQDVPFSFFFRNLLEVDNRRKENSGQVLHRRGGFRYWLNVIGASTEVVPRLDPMQSLTPFISLLTNLFSPVLFPPQHEPT